MNAEMNTEAVRRFFTDPKAIYTTAEFARLLGWTSAEVRRVFAHLGDRSSGRYAFQRAAVLDELLLWSGAVAVAETLASLNIPVSGGDLLQFVAKPVAEGDTPVFLTPETIEAADRLVTNKSLRIRFGECPEARHFPTRTSVVNELIQSATEPFESGENPGFIAALFTRNMKEHVEHLLDGMKESVERHAEFLLKMSAEFTDYGQEPKRSEKSEEEVSHA